MSFAKQPTQPPQFDAGALAKFLKLPETMAAQLVEWKRWVGAEITQDGKGLRDVVAANATGLNAVKADVDAHGAEITTLQQTLAQVQQQVAALEAKPPFRHELGVFAQTGWVVRSPASGSEAEKIQALKRTGLDGWLLFNVRDYTPDQWQSWRMLAAANHIPYGPWGRVYEDDTFVQQLIDIGLDWESPVIGPNVEKPEVEAGMTPAHLATLLQPWQREVGVLIDRVGYVDGSGYHGPDWTPLGDRAVAVCEVLKDETPTIDPVESQALARHAGFQLMIPLLGTKIGPENYPTASRPRGMYTLDNVDAAQVGAWA